MTSRETNKVEFITRGARQVRITIVHDSLEDLAYQYRRDPSQIIAEHALTEAIAEAPIAPEQPAAANNIVSMADYRTVTTPEATAPPSPAEIAPSDASVLDFTERARQQVADSYNSAAQQGAIESLHDRFSA